jgi:hypothetical protein
MTDTLGRRVRNYIEDNPTASVGQVLGRFVLDPDEYADLVADQLGTARRTSDDTPGGVEA